MLGGLSSSYILYTQNNHFDNMHTLRMLKIRQKRPGPFLYYFSNNGLLIVKSQKGPIAVLVPSISYK